MAQNQSLVAHRTANMEKILVHCRAQAFLAQKFRNLASIHEDLAETLDEMYPQIENRHLAQEERARAAQYLNNFYRISTSERRNQMLIEDLERRFSARESQGFVADDEIASTVCGSSVTTPARTRPSSRIDEKRILSLGESQTLKNNRMARATKAEDLSAHAAKFYTTIVRSSASSPANDEHNQDHTSGQRQTATENHISSVDVVQEVAPTPFRTVKLDEDEKAGYLGSAAESTELHKLEVERDEPVTGSGTLSAVNAHAPDTEPMRLYGVPPFSIHFPDRHTPVTQEG